MTAKHYLKGSTTIMGSPKKPLILPSLSKIIFYQLLIFLSIITCSIYSWSKIGPLSAADDFTIDKNRMILEKVKENSSNKLAKCLDGSQPAYYIRKGFGDGADKFMLYLEGGGWCYFENLEKFRAQFVVGNYSGISYETFENWEKLKNSDQHGEYQKMNFCDYRKNSKLGSTLNDDQDMKTTDFGILSSNPARNPNFYNWNLVWFRYCDGGSFSGTREDTGLSPPSDDNSPIYYRGKYIFDAIIQDLEEKYDLGSSTIKNIVLSGTSAGGLATFLRCDDLKYDKFKYQVEKYDLDIKCIADTGFFLDQASISGKQVIRTQYQSMIELHQIARPQFCSSSSSSSSHKSPISKMYSKSFCLFPEYFADQIKTKFLIVQPLYDAWQTTNVWFPEDINLLPDAEWYACAKNLNDCKPLQRQIAEVYRSSTAKALFSLLERNGKEESNNNLSVYLHSCHIHSQIIFPPFEKILVDGKSIKKVVSEFMNENSYNQVVIDGHSFGENPSCKSFRGFG